MVLSHWFNTRIKVYVVPKQWYEGANEYSTITSSVLKNCKEYSCVFLDILWRVLTGGTLVLR